MLFPDTLILVRGGGDLGTGAVWRLHRAGFPVVVTELAEPLAIRRRVAVGSAIVDGRIEIQGMTAEPVAEAQEARTTAASAVIAVLATQHLPAVGAAVVVDARMAKEPGDTTIRDGELVVGLGPGFEAGVHCHAVVETKRGHDLGRVIWKGAALPNTGQPGFIGGRTNERIVRAEAAGSPQWIHEIGDVVEPGAVLGTLGGQEVEAPIGGVVRGLISQRTFVEAGVKIADIDPRGDPTAAFQISDKALAVGAGVLEAVLTWLNR